MNQVELTSDDMERRWKDANTPNKVSRAGSQHCQQLRTSCLCLCMYTVRRAVWRAVRRACACSGILVSI